ncbi:GNAT family N-acetyltransferase [Pseudoruegeria sp. SHC-113]|uniref:GNAT family N-acetyltransferase n=1 Tax=Pseudoruegeria sp. SHC-113 TaxID=2855439 RepID=UPI0021BAE81B|nr:GNAT family N-acetyltransferase [Pseudoruegeria sp. SHC-113]MCT8159097.1 GNAT family N-acetyltransferase [Pseudoruegeria sp. SHC-113]
MQSPDRAALFAALEATWPAARLETIGPWHIRFGAGGGKRVSAATPAGPVSEADIPQAEAAMHALGQDPLFMIRPEDSALDTALAARGYALVDPVRLYVAPIEALAAIDTERLSGFAIWPPLAIQEEIWAEAGIGAARLAVMPRAQGPKAAILGRAEARAAGTAFVALHGEIAMLHALEVSPQMRRKQAARKMMGVAAQWAQKAGARWMALAVTRENMPANALYASLGMASVETYHYRQLASAGAPDT